MASKHTALTAQARAKAGKGAARATRRTGQVPCVIYGDSKDAVLISVLEKDLVKANSSQAFFTKLCDLDVAGQKYLTVPRDVQLDPVTDRPIHADFLRVSDKTVIRVQVPITVKNHKDSPGLARGGVLNLVRHELEVSCRAADIPEEFVIDLSGLDVGNSIHVSDIKLPAGITPTLQGKYTVVTIVAPSAMKSEAEEAAAAAAAAAGVTADAAAAVPGAPGAPVAGAAAPAAAAKDAGKDAKAKK